MRSHPIGPFGDSASYLLVLVLVLAAGRAGHAQTDSIRSYTLDEIVVTAARMKTDAFQTGRSISVIPGSAIAHSLSVTVTDFMRDTPGLYALGNGQTPGSLQTMSLRGANNNETVVMIDGVQLSDPSSVDNATDLSELSFGDVERIEIVRGTQSTLYGSSAIGGVVNVLSRKSYDPGFSGSAGSTAGTFGSGTSLFRQNLSAAYGWRSGWYLAATIRHMAVQGLNASEDTVRSPGAYKAKDLSDEFHQTYWMGRAGYHSADVNLYASYGHTGQLAEIDKAAYVDDDNYTLDFARRFVTYGGDYAWTPRIHLSYVGGYTALRRLSNDDSSQVDAAGTTDHGYAHGRYQGSQWTNELQAQIHMTGIETVIGAGLYRETMSVHADYLNTAFQYESITDYDSLDLHADTRDVFARTILDGGLLGPGWSRLQMAVGGRLHHHSTYGYHATYDVNPSLRISDRSLVYASYSTGFKAPSLYQLYAPERDFGTGISRGNSGLNPETSHAWEIGFKERVGTGGLLTAAYFRTAVDHVIDYVYLWNEVRPTDSLTFDDYRGDTYLNLGKLVTQGVEGTFSYLVNANWRVSGNATILWGELHYRAPAVPDPHAEGHQVQVLANGLFVNDRAQTSRLVRRPRTANASVEYRPSEQAAAEIAVRYTGSRRDVYYDGSLGPFGALGAQKVRAYKLVDLSAQYHIGKHWLVACKLENVMNTRFREINGFATRGRAVYVRLDYGIGAP